MRVKAKDVYLMEEKPTVFLYDMAALERMVGVYHIDILDVGQGIIPHSPRRYLLHLRVCDQEAG